jgi:hypothetical protein
MFDERNLIPFIPVLIFWAGLALGFGYAHWADRRAARELRGARR